jgi:hypothetical protein
LNLKKDETVGGLKNCLVRGFIARALLPNGIIVMKSMRLRWAGHVGHIGKKVSSCKVLVGEPEGKR